MVASRKAPTIAGLNMELRAWGTVWRHWVGFKRSWQATGRVLSGVPSAMVGVWESSWSSGMGYGALSWGCCLDLVWGGIKSP